MQINSSSFLLSSPDIKRCPVSSMPEFAFIGRSNVGKSSLINMLTVKGLAKVSTTPGKTRLINFFLINEKWHLVDLPGFGFAKISKDERSKLARMIEDYLLKRDNLRLTFLLVDSRLEPQKIDMEFISWLIKNELPFVILFTKTDKLSRNQLRANEASYKKLIAAQLHMEPDIVLTSAEKKTGKDEVLDIIQGLLD